MKFISPKAGRKRGKYEVAEGDASTPAFMQGSVFGTVLRTMKMFEQKEVLGRPKPFVSDPPETEAMEVISALFPESAG